MTSLKARIYRRNGQWRATLGDVNGAGVTPLEAWDRVWWLYWSLKYLSEKQKPW